MDRQAGCANTPRSALGPTELRVATHRDRREDCRRRSPFDSNTIYRQTTARVALSNLTVGGCPQPRRAGAWPADVFCGRRRSRAARAGGTAPRDGTYLAGTARSLASCRDRPVAGQGRPALSDETERARWRQSWRDMLASLDVAEAADPAVRAVDPLDPKAGAIADDGTRASENDENTSGTQ